jgi:hypothetical protein
MADIDASFKKPELKVVLDTNVRISALLRGGKTCRNHKGSRKRKKSFL